MYISDSRPTKQRAFCHHVRPRRLLVVVAVSVAVCWSDSPRRCSWSCSCIMLPAAVRVSRACVCRRRLESCTESERWRRWVVSRSRGGFPVSVSAGRLVSYSRVTVSTSSAVVRLRVRSMASCSRRASHNSRKKMLSRVISRSAANCSCVLFVRCSCVLASRFCGLQFENNRTLSSVRAGRNLADSLFQS